MYLPNKSYVPSIRSGTGVLHKDGAVHRVFARYFPSPERCSKSKMKAKYKKEYPRLLYSFFISYSDTSSLPSFSKFARSIGVTTQDIEQFRNHKEFDRAYRECNEIKRDYLTDYALCKRFDPSFAKFLLSSEGNSELCESDGSEKINFTLEVLEQK